MAAPTGTPNDRTQNLAVPNGAWTNIANPNGGRTLVVSPTEDIWLIVDEVAAAPVDTGYPVYAGQHFPINNLILPPSFNISFEASGLIAVQVRSQAALALADVHIYWFR